ncbi:MAG: hypothetical protein JWM62_1617, partial [Frankiales bacterium]|nr:hypothetical protein [Frankiales bacterium]
MAHPTEGVLRRLLDEPSGVAELDRRHVADCAQCRAELAAGQTDSDLVAAALTPPSVDDLDVDAAWLRLTAGAPAPQRVVARTRRR